MKISSRAHGQGPVVIFLHGFAGSVLHWDPVINNLKNHFTCVVVNYSHFYMGRSALSFSEQADTLAHWLREKYPNQKLHFVGLSFGAALTWAIGLKYPEMMSRAVFINPMPPAPTKHFALKGMRIFFHLPMSRGVIMAFLTTYFGRGFLKKCAQIFRLQSKRETRRLEHLEGKKRLFVGHLFNNFAWILKSENWTQWSQALNKNWNHKSLMIFDDQDPLFAKPCYSDFYELIKAENKVVTTGAGHVSIQGLPHLISREIVGFLTKEINTKAS